MVLFHRSFLLVCILCLSYFYQLTYAQTTNSTIANNANGTTKTTSQTATTNGNNIFTTNTNTTISNSNPTVLTNTTTIIASTSATVSIATATVSTITTTTLIPITTMTTSQRTSSLTSSTRLPNDRQGPGWWLLVALIITIVIVIIVGIVFYQRQISPYRQSTSHSQGCRQRLSRFIRNFRSRRDYSDNIFLQLEQPESYNNQRSPRISFT